MPKKTLRNHLRKARPRRGESVPWRALYAEALLRAQEAGDLRAKTLLHFKDTPEKALRRLSILSRVDLDREFPPNPD